MEEIESLKMRLAFSQDQTVQHQLESEISKRQVVADQLTRIRESRGVTFIGLGGWLAHLFETNQLSESEYKSYISVVNVNFIDISQFYSLYAKVFSTTEIGDRFSWAIWDMNERPESYGDVDVQPIGTSDWLGRYYTYRALELMPFTPEAAPDLPATAVSTALAELVANNLERFRTSAIWGTMIVEPSPDAFEQRAQTLKAVHEKAAQRQRTVEEDELIDQHLDDNLIQKFADDIVETWSRVSVIRNLVTQFGRYEERPDADIPKGSFALGIKQLEPKGVFVAQSRVDYLAWGENHGRSLAHGEDARLELAFAALPQKEALLADFDAVLSEAIRELQARIQANDLI